MFASLVQRDITLKVDAPEVVSFLGADEVTVTIRKLSASSLEKAKQQATIVNATSLRAMGGELIRELSAPTSSAALDEAARNVAEKKKTAEGRRKGILSEYDRPTVLLQGVVRWSCEDKKPLKDGLAELDEEHAQRIFEAILDLSDRRLSPEALEAEGKDASAASTSF